MIGEWINKETGETIRAFELIWTKPIGTNWQAVVPAHRFVVKGYSLYEFTGDWADNANQQILNFLQYYQGGIE